MPQLDFLIILPQIFWFILSFTFFYFILTYYFLPIFLKTINSRREFIKFNKNSESRLDNEILLKRQFILKKFTSDLSEIKSVIFLNLLKFKSTKPFKLQSSKLNAKISTALNKSVIYCNLDLINLIKFYPSLLNKKI